MTRGCRGRNCAGPKSTLQPELVRVRSPPRRANIRREPLFRTQARKRPPGDQVILPTQYDLKEKISEASSEIK